MLRRHIIQYVSSFLCCWLAFVGLPGCSTGPDEAHVVSVVPSGEVSNNWETIEIMFDRPMVPAELVGQALTDLPVSIEPALSVEGHWRDRQSLVLARKSKPLAGTSYTVSIAPMIGGNVVAKDHLEQQFVNRPLRFEGVREAETNLFPPKKPFKLAFSTAVRASDIEAKCRLESADGKNVPLLATDPSASAKLVQVSHAEPLVQGEKYTLRCSELFADGGNVAAKEPVKLPLRVYPEAFVTGTSPVDDATVTPDQREIVINMSTPVDLDQIVKYVTIEPAVKDFEKGWYSQGSTFRQIVDLEPSTAYTLTVDHRLIDQFGQSLRTGKDTKSSFRTTDASPRIFVEGGLHAIESGRGGYPVWSRNVTEIEVQCATVPKSKLVSILSGRIDYFPYDTTKSPSTPLDWSRLDLEPRTTKLRPDSTLNKWQEKRLDLRSACAGDGDGTESGFYLAEFRSKEVHESLKETDWRNYPYRTLSNVTGLGLVLKAGANSGLAWVTRVSTGEAVANAAVTVHSPDGKVVHVATTDARGLAQLPGTDTLLKAFRARPETEEDHGYSWRSAQRLLVVAEADDQIAAVDGYWSDGLQAWNFGANGASPRDTAVRGFLLSDRGIYRPGETVHFKGFVRELRAAQPPRLPSDTTVAIQVRDAKGTQVASRELSLSEFGSFSLDHELNPAAALGDYVVTATVGAQTFYEHFSVQEFRPIEFDLTPQTPDPPTPRLLGQPIDVSFNAAYLFGSPVTGATADWNVTRRQGYLDFGHLPGFSFQDADSVSDGNHIANGTLETNGIGDVAFQFSDGYADLSGPQDYVVSVGVTDATEQRVSRQAVIRAHATDAYLGVRIKEWVTTAGEPFRFDLASITPNGKFLATKAQLSLTRSEYRCARIKDSPYRRWDCTHIKTPIWTRDVEIDGKGIHTETVTPAEAGRYIIRIDGKDRRGNVIAATDTVWVVGDGANSWTGGDESVRMEIVQSKKKYEVGDVARLVPQADLAGMTVLLSIERDGIVETRIEKIESGVPSFDIPITVAYAPNVYVSLVAVRGRSGEDDREDLPRFRMGATDLRVNFESKRLRVNIHTEKEAYKPGEWVKGHVRVVSGTDPVRAEIAVSVADEGVLKLINFATPDPMKTFYAPWGWAVDASTNWNHFLRYTLPRGAEGEEGHDGGGGARVRSNFVSSAFWAPALVTDAEGRAAFRFKAPDNLTAFRIMAAAADTGDRFGSGDHTIRVRKDLMVRSILPRFFNEEDEVEIGAVVHNYSSTGGNVTFHFESEVLTPRVLDKTVHIAANGKERVLFRVNVPRDKLDADVLFKASMGTHRDALKKRLPIRIPIVTDRLPVLVGNMQEAGSVDAELTWPEQTLANRSRFTVAVDRTGLSDLGPSLRYVIGYPYGCLEQTLSRLIPMFKVNDLVSGIDVEELKDKKQLDRFVRAGVGKILRQQDQRGHFSLWPDSESSPHLTAYALYGLSEGRNADVSIPQEPIDRGLSALRDWAASNDRTFAPGGETATLAMAAYALAIWKQPDPGLNAKLFESRRALPMYGKAFLIRALFASSGPRKQIDALLDDLRAAARPAVGGRVGDPAAPRQEGALIPEDDIDQRYFSSNVRSSAIALSAFLLAAPGDPLIPRLVAGLKGARLKAGYWYNTQDNLYSLVAIADYSRARSDGRSRVKVLLGDKLLAEEELRGSKVLQLSLPLTDMAPGELRIESDGAAYYSARVELARRPLDNDSVSNGMVLSREYRDAKTGKPLFDTATVGQLIEVRLKVRSARYKQNLALVDPLPGGFEVVNLALATERGTVSTAKHGSWWTHQELRDDRAMAFMDEPWREEESFVYLARATRPGTYVVPAALVEQMYDPDVRARTLSTKFTVEPAASKEVSHAAPALQ